MTKQEFIDRVARQGGLSRTQAAKAVDAVLDSITEVLRSGGEVNFTGFGKFSTQHREERQGVNPRSPREKVTIPAATVPKFSAGSSLKTAVRRGGGLRHGATFDAEPAAYGADAEALPGEPGVPWEEDEEWRSR
jgi:DNA-binding protein HU-beta